MLKSAYLHAKIGADTAENERNFAQKLSKKLAATLPSVPAPMLFSPAALLLLPAGVHPVLAAGPVPLPPPDEASIAEKVRVNSGEIFLYIGNLGKSEDNLCFSSSGKH